MVFSMQNNRRGLEFQASTIETIDAAIHNYIKELNLHAATNKGFIPVPIIWVGAERTYQLKNDLSIRDSEGLLKLPLITIERKEIEKDPSKSLIPANVPEYGKGGYIRVRRRIKQDKTTNFKNAQNLKKSGGDENVGSDDREFIMERKFPARVSKMFDTRPITAKGKTVYETVFIPVPVYVNVKYEVHLRTEYQQQMNQLLTPFISGNRQGRNHKYFTVTEDNHMFEGFIENSFSNDNNAAKLDEEERIFNSVINISILGYLIGGGDNENANLAKTYESIVELKVSRERVILADEFDRTNPSGSDPFYKE
mgnify:CR=1 FL=1